MKKAQKGDRVRIHFTVQTKNGNQIADTRLETPMELTIGEKKLLDCFEQSVLDMAEGEKRTVRLDPKHTVGEIRPELIFKLPRYTVPEQHEDLTIGSKVQVEIEIENGNTISGRVSDLSDIEVTVDSNHRLAGKTLIFDVELIEFV